jgi:hypothetical protein
VTAQARDFLEAEICLWCGNYSCTCDDAPDEEYPEEEIFLRLLRVLTW